MAERLGPVRFLPVGDRAVLVELDTNARVHAVARTVRERFDSELEEVVPGHTTVLLVWRSGLSADAGLMSHLRTQIETSSASRSDTTDSGAPDGEAVTIAVTYDGPDLERVADALEVSTEALAELHAGIAFTVAFMGFAPGFPYLIPAGEARGGDLSPQAAALLALPRLGTPRTDVPAGSVAVAAGYCGIYPRSSPGGWNLLGRTDAVLFDATRERPALLEPGSEVRFVAG